ncbi:MAG TPA: glycosyltransferase family 1 protein [Candidatus Sulfopaludibacter sp.]|jgi:glycosyltransferase involved in cell wall biosynthesis|nr:glycosyltransferase family 1 protein [Candidatus Sulfopaludibacter sp.]
MRPLRIGVNGLYLIPGGVGGTEIYLRGLLAALAEIDPVNRYFIFTNRETGADLVPKSPNFEQLPQSVRAVSRPARILWEQTALPLAAVRLGLDVMLNPGFTAPLLCPCPQVTVFHDLQHKRHPEYFRWFDLPFWNFFLFWSAQVSRLVLADSDATAADLRLFYRLPESKIRVATLGVDPAFFEIAARRLPEPFLLAASTLHPHKNLDGLLRAFAQFRTTHPGFRLIVCGIHGFFTGPLEELRASLGLQDAVDFPGWIPRADLHDLYARAWAFVYPSKFEGFGLPVPEAMAAAIPTACSNIQPLAGIAGDAALQFDPLDIAAITAAMVHIVDDPGLRAHLALAGPRRVARFTWRATAQSTLAALTSTVQPRLS